MSRHDRLPVLAVVLALGGCPAAKEPDSHARDISLAHPAPPLIAFTHRNGSRGDHSIVEILGPGGAAVDVDGDGDLDLVLRQGAPLDDIASGQGDTLLLNQSRRGASERGPLAFVEASAGSGLEVPAYGLGIAVGDVNGDGIVDLFLANAGLDRLLLGRGDATFADATDASGLASADSQAITGASTFFDCDDDGDLDLYVGSYVTVGPRPPVCTTPTGRPDYCGPLSFPSASGRLLENDGSGHFTDISSRSGISSSPANALGAVAADFDRDGRSDLFVASDATANQLWINQGACHFADEAALRGLALNGGGLRTGDMGVELGDVDNDADLDLVSTHIRGEMHSLWIDHGGGQFEDGAVRLGLGAATAWATGFGVAMLDLDNDGRLDLLVANGSVRIDEGLATAGDPLPLRQPAQLLRNDGVGFVDVSEQGGPAIRETAVGRGVVVADFDDDGDHDAVILRNDGPAVLFMSRASQLGSWIGLRLVLASGAPAIGSEVVLEQGTLRRIGRIHTDGSYASARDDRVLFGLGAASQPVSLSIRWPDGQVQRVGPLEVDHYHHLVAPTEKHGR